MREPKGELEYGPAKPNLFDGCFKAFQWILMAFSIDFLEWSIGFSSEFHRCFKGLSRVIQQCFKHVLWVFQECFMSVSRDFKGSFKGV